MEVELGLQLDGCLWGLSPLWPPQMRDTFGPYASRGCGMKGSASVHSPSR